MRGALGPCRAGVGRTALVLFGVCFASGCASLAPEYKRPAAPVERTFPFDERLPSTVAEKTGHAVQVPFSTFIKDERLAKLVERALTDNRSLRMAVAAIVAARALYDREQAGRWPSLQAELSASLGRNVSPAFSGAAFSQERYQVGFALPSYELDLFGRLRNLSEAARERYLGQVQAARAVRLSLIGDVAVGFIAWAAANSRRELADRTAALAQQAMELNERRLQGGIGSRVDVRQAETVYQRARADVARYTADSARSHNGLQLLVGGALPTNVEGDDGATAAPVLTADAGWFSTMPSGLSSRVLLRRPDVMEAEAYLRAAHADIGAARAAHFPRISLTAALGLASTALSAFSGGGTPVWSVNPAANVPIFAAGGIEANVEYRQAERARLVASYELTIQTAFKEVADALAARSTIVEQVAAVQAQVRAAQEVYRLSEARYRNGVDAYLETLDAQRSLYEAEQALITAQQAELNNRVAVYRTLGGQFELRPRGDGGDDEF